MWKSQMGSICGQSIGHYLHPCPLHWFVAVIYIGKRPGFVFGFSGLEGKWNGQHVVWLPFCLRGVVWLWRREECTPQFWVEFTVAPSQWGPKLQLCTDKWREGGCSFPVIIEAALFCLGTPWSWSRSSGGDTTLLAKCLASATHGSSSAHHGCYCGIPFRFLNSESIFSLFCTRTHIVVKYEI